MSHRSTNPHEKSIRELHAVGKAVTKADARIGTRGEAGRHWGSVRQISAARGRTRSYVYVARVFYGQYPSEQQLAALIKLGVKQGRPLSSSHVMRLTAVPQARQRNQLARQAAREGWSVSRLTQEIQKLRGKRSYGGRRPAPPSDPHQALLELRGMAEKWLRWTAELDPPGEMSGGLAALPATIQRQLGRIDEQMTQLLRALQE